MKIKGLHQSKNYNQYNKSTIKIRRVKNEIIQNFCKFKAQLVENKENNNNLNCKSYGPFLPKISNRSQAESPQKQVIHKSDSEKKYNHLVYFKHNDNMNKENNCQIQKI